MPDPETLHDRPSAAELVIAVREYLEQDVMPSTEGRVAFHARVAANVLRMVERELTLAATQTAQESERLVQLLGHEGTIRELTIELAKAIRAGDWDTRQADVHKCVRATVRAKLEVANPEYLLAGDEQ
ncbi:MAG: hypothetical protein EXQ69_00445 [Acidimicrobiia bacterium]|nr:hypothetical protein [Acidimicrobiia bacterium]